MLELTDAPDQLARLSYGGDTLNTAVYLSRLGMKTGYLTALGDDPYSGNLRRAWRDEGVDLAAVATVAGRAPGLYAVHVDETGERSFTYWRGESAARHLFTASNLQEVLSAARQADALYLSLISLSIFHEGDRARLIDLARDFKSAGKTVAFDTNYRPRGWPSVDAARAAVDAIAPHLTLVLPTLDDDRILFADADATACLARWRRYGVNEAVVKNGPVGATAMLGDATVFAATPPRRDPVVDTTGAGDSFNAGYLAARLAGRSLAAALQQGHVVAGAVIGHRGAIIPRTAMPTLTEA